MFDITYAYFLVKYFILAPYFIDCISEQDLDEMNIEIIRNTLYKVHKRMTIGYYNYRFLGPTPKVRGL